LGALPVHLVSDYADRLPEQWKQQDGIFVPAFLAEAMWLGFSGANWKPNAVRVAVGQTDAVSGKAWEEKLHRDPQNYLVCPPQLALDGIYSGEGDVRQFAVSDVGAAVTKRSKLSKAEAIRIIVYDPKPGKFPHTPPPVPPRGPDVMHSRASSSGGSLGIEPGGAIEDAIMLDPFGPDTWDSANYGDVFVHMLEAESYRQITGLEPPPPIEEVRGYEKWRLP